MNNDKEKNLLWVSVAAAILFSGAGIILGILFQSQMILFDGLYSLISVVLSYMSLLAAGFMSKADWKRFPFGKDSVEPLVVLIKYAVILILVAASFLAAAAALFQGGREMQVGPAFVYSLIGMSACLGVFYFLKKYAEKGSALIKAEANQWLMDSLVSVGVFIGFLAAFLLQITETALWIIPYIDPLMVIAVSIYFLQFPLREMKKALREVLEMSPEGPVQKRIETSVQAVKEEYGIEESFLRITKVGRTIWVEIDFVTASDDLGSLKIQDQIREKIAGSMDDAAPKKWLTVSFMKDRRWALEE
jgi:cation diffusion facilitator family transporter